MLKFTVILCKRNYLARGNLAKLVFWLILFYVIGFFKTASWDEMKNTKSQPKYLDE